VTEGVDLPDQPSGSSIESNGEASLVSFVVHIWSEESAEEPQTIWRGHITLVPNGRRQYFTSIEEIPGLITRHLMKQE
jgi:hypothetical protein